MIIGAIDVGTNSVKLLIAEVEGSSFRMVGKRTTQTRLGSGLASAKKMSREAMALSIATIREYRRLCDAAGADKIMVVGTEALRRAKNGPDFARQCESEAGLMLQIIGPADEARLAFAGATHDQADESVAAMDIGGGSTEIMIGAPGRLNASMSLRMGAVALTEKYLVSADPGPMEYHELREAVCAELEKLPPRIRKKASEEASIIAIGGTCVNLGSIYASRKAPKRIPVHGMRLPLSTVNKIFTRLSSLDLESRKKVIGLDPERADIICAGAAILLETMMFLEVPSVTLSVHGLRKGLILETAREMTAR